MGRPLLMDSNDQHRQKEVSLVPLSFSLSLFHFISSSIPSYLRLFFTLSLSLLFLSFFSYFFFVVIFFPRRFLTHSFCIWFTFVNLYLSLPISCKQTHTQTRFLFLFLSFSHSHSETYILLKNVPYIHAG